MPDVMSFWIAPVPTLGKRLRDLLSMYDPDVHIHKTVLMQRLLDAVRAGYHWHTAGTVPAHRAQRMADKFAARYAVHRNSSQRAYAKRQRRCNARLFLYLPPESNDLHWWLLATEGEGAVHQEERLSIATGPRTRVRVLADYELLRRTRSRANGGGTAWTWRMTSECVTAWRERIILACRRREPVVITQAMGSLYRSPGFSGIRRQVGTLVALARKEWRRRHGTLDGLVLPPALPYVERLPNTVLPLSEPIARLDPKPRSGAPRNRS